MLLLRHRIPQNDLPNLYNQCHNWQNLLERKKWSVHFVLFNRVCILTIWKRQKFTVHFCQPQYSIYITSTSDFHLNKWGTSVCFSTCKTHFVENFLYIIFCVRNLKSRETKQKLLISNFFHKQTRSSAYAFVNQVLTWIIFN